MRKAMLALIIAIAWISLIPALLSTAASAANSASFVKTDSSTMGSWVGVYGANGDFVSQDGTIKNPSYAKVVFSEDANWTWTASSNHLPALQKPEKPSDRIAGQWFTGNSFFDVNVTDGNTHQVALYALDWDQDMRAETIKVHDASTGAVLDSRLLSAGSFIEGTYLIWNVQGHVTFEVDRNAGANATLSGVFFDSEAVNQGAAKLCPPIISLIRSVSIRVRLSCVDGSPLPVHGNPQLSHRHQEPHEPSSRECAPASALTSPVRA
jgi:hypothetical protein